MKKLLKNIVVYSFYYLNLYPVIRFVKSLFKGHCLTIVLYHSFSEDGTGQDSLPVRLLDKHLRYLKKNYAIEPLDSVMQKFKEGKRLDRDTLCITIDDGFLDNYKFAYPIFNKYTIPATIFVTAGLLECPTRKSTFEEDLIHPDKVCFENDIDHADTYRLSKLPMMSWPQVKDLISDNIEIGSHTLYHPILTKVPFDVAKKEIILSKSKIESELNKEIRYFAFPNGLVGDYNDNLCASVKNAGYQASFIVSWGVNYSNQNLFKLNRIPLGSISVARLAAKVNMIVSGL